MTPIEVADGRLRLIPGRIARIEINAPQRRNAFSRDMWAGLSTLCASIEQDGSIRCVMLSAAPSPDGAFCAGADIGEFAEVYSSPESAGAYNAVVRAAQARLRDLPRPVIAVVGGACVGGGCGLALSCDLRFAGVGARFGITPAKIGIAYSPQDTAQLIEKVGAARAKDLLFSARLVDAAEAMAMGLVDRVLPAEELDAAALAYAENLANMSPLSLATAKATINRLGAPDEAVCAQLHGAFAATFSSADFAEGRAAFLARRPPNFG